MSSQDGDIHILLAGKSACEITSLEDLLNRLVNAAAQDLGDVQASEPYSVQIDDREGLAVDVSGTHWQRADGERYGYKLAGRAAIVAQDDSQLFFAFASASERTMSDR